MPRACAGDLVCSPLLCDAAPLSLSVRPACKSRRRRAAVVCCHQPYHLYVRARVF